MAFDSWILFWLETMTFGRVAGRKQQKRCCNQLRMKDVDEETLQIYEIQREIQSLKHELREQQWSLEEKLSMSPVVTLSMTIVVKFVYECENSFVTTALNRRTSTCAIESLSFKTKTES